MQRLQKATVSSTSAAACAAEILDAVPVVLQFIRVQMRLYNRPDLSVQQLRALAFVDRSPGASLSMLAQFLGLSLPAASRLVDGLQARRLTLRRTPPQDRRLLALALSAAGRRTVRAARRAAEERLAQILAPLPTAERAAMQRSLRILRQTVQSPPPETLSPPSPQPARGLNSAPPWPR